MSRPTRSTLFSIRPSNARCPTRMCSPPCRRRQRASPTLLTRGESVAIFGDYDVDGATSAAVLARFLRFGGVEPIIHIPDRLFEGYGPNVEAVRALAARGATLLVTVDCGTTSVEPLSGANALGIDVVVIDHHQADEALPPARGDRQSEPARRSFRTRLSRRGRARVHDRGGGQSRVARPRFLDRGAARARSARRFSTTWRSAPSPTWCR